MNRSSSSRSASHSREKSMTREHPCRGSSKPAPAAEEMAARRHLDDFVHLLVHTSAADPSGRSRDVLLSQSMAALLVAALSIRAQMQTKSARANSRCAILFLTAFESPVPGRSTNTHPPRRISHGPQSFAHLTNGHTWKGAPRDPTDPEKAASSPGLHTKRSSSKVMILGKATPRLCRKTSSMTDRCEILMLLPRAVAVTLFRMLLCCEASSENVDTPLRSCEPPLLAARIAARVNSHASTCVHFRCPPYPAGTQSCHIHGPENQ